jgi:hypothetical protein
MRDFERYATTVAAFIRPPRSVDLVLAKRNAKTEFTEMFSDESFD